MWWIISSGLAVAILGFGFYADWDFAMIVGGLALVFVAGWGATVAYETHVCAEVGVVIGMETEFSVWTDCMVDTPNGWFPYDQLRDIER